MILYRKEIQCSHLILYLQRNMKIDIFFKVQFWSNVIWTSFCLFWIIQIFWLFFWLHNMFHCMQAILKHLFSGGKKCSISKSSRMITLLSRFLLPGSQSSINPVVHPILHFCNLIASFRLLHIDTRSSVSRLEFHIFLPVGTINFQVDRKIDSWQYLLKNSFEISYHHSFTTDPALPVSLVDSC